MASPVSLPHLSAHLHDRLRRAGVAPQRWLVCQSQEQAHYIAHNPRSAKVAKAAAQHLMFGVPLHWMNDWSTPFPLVVSHAHGAHLTDLDGHQRIDFCLGDTGAMFGHSPAPVVAALAQQAQKGLTTMLMNEDAIAVGALLAERFALPQWQFAMTASDANRFVLRWVRAATQRPVVVVFNGCYHGTVDDALVDRVGGVTVTRASLLGQVQDLGLTTRVVEFNDLAGLEAALALGDVACVLAEPVMTNIGMVLPQPNYWEQAIPLIHQYGSLLVLDETHTISTGPGGYARAHGLQPDALVVGKPLGGGMPCAAYGMSAALAEQAQKAKREAPPGHSGIGTTLTANALAMAAMRATLQHCMTPATYAPMLKGATELAKGLRDLVSRFALPWCVTQVGARVELQFCATPPANGQEAEQILLPELEQVMHLYLLNRGVLITPFHNMMLVSPATTVADVQQLLHVLQDFVRQVLPPHQLPPAP